MTQEDKELMLSIHNKSRKTPLVMSEKLEKAAQTHAETMSRIRRLTHRNLTKRVKLVGYNYINIGENVAVGQKTVENVMNSWLKSWGHSRNIKGNFTEVGFGKSGNYWCVIFGTPKT